MDKQAEEILDKIAGLDGFPQFWVGKIAEILTTQEGESDNQIAKRMVQDAYDDGVIGQQAYIDLMQYGWLDKDGE